MVSLRTYSIVVGVACTVSVGAGYMQYLLENKIGSTEVCKKSIDMMHGHKLSVDNLGPPVKVGRPNVLNKFTVITETTANIAIPVKGEKSKGDLLISVFKEDAADLTWKWKYLKISRDKEDDLVIISEEVTK